MKKKPQELEFISIIKRDGSGVKKISKEHLKFLMENKFEEYFELHKLSITEKTYIAFNFNAYVVKLNV
jgi:hypothetical protein